MMSGARGSSLPSAILLIFLPFTTWCMEDVYANPLFDCGPLKTACFCTYSDKNYELQCPSADEPSVLVKYAPVDYLDVDCLDNPSRNLFTLPDLTAQGIRRLSFRNCTLPIEGLDALCTKFNLVSVDQLIIQITSFENITLTSAFLGVIRTSLKQLSLEGNGLREIPAETYSGMSNLLVLDLNSNEITKLESKYFKHAPNLQELDLSRNLLETIADDAFDGLTRLRRLHLWSNRFKTLPSKVFLTMSSLQSLELSVNKLDVLSDGLFHPLKSLVEVNLRANNLSDLQSNLFEMNANLKTVRLDSNHNLETLPNGFFTNSTLLADVQIFRCGLRSLPGDLFRGPNNLTRLILHHNFLTQLPDELFLGLEHLQSLDLNNNQIESISLKMFESLHALKALDLSANSLQQLPLDSLKALGSLETLSLKENNISEIEGFRFNGVDNLRILDLSRNKLSLRQNATAYNFFMEDYEMLFDSLFNLEELDLSYNRISYLQVQWLMNKSKFKKISLQHNYVDKLEYDSLQTTSNEKELNIHLDENRITTVNFAGALILARTNPNSTIFVVHLAGNPWNCDCHLYDLLKYYKLELDPEIRARVDLRSNEYQPMMCHSPRQFRTWQITELPLTALSCPLIVPNDIRACPDKCTCHYRPYGKALIVDCVKSNLTSLPSLLLPSATAAEQQMIFQNVSWNDTGACSLEVWAQGNNMKSIVETPGYHDVSVLNVSGNVIREIKWLPAKLKVLNLHNNSLQRLSEDILAALNETSNITLDNNPWLCNCEALGLSNFIRDHFIDNEIRCGRNGLLLRKLTQSELCPSSALTILLVAIPLLLLLLLCASLAVFYYRYQRAVKVWLYARPLTQWLVAQEDLDRDKVYDAFICYAHEDEDYVEKLLKELEGGDRPYKVCIHRRDWMPGAMIAEQINDSLRQSRRAIVVLSPAFVRSEWARMEFRTAHANDLKEGRARLIVILLGHLDPQVLQDDEDLRAYCSTKTYLKHDDPLFWQKLRYSMPHRGIRKPQSVSSSANGKVSRLGQIMVNIERQDLCATPTTPNPGTTPPAHALGTEETLLRRLDPMDFLVKGGKIDCTHLQTTATA